MSADPSTNGFRNASEAAERFKAKSAEQVPPPRSRVAAFSTIERELIDYLLPGLPIGRATLLGGDGGLGKSMLTAQWASRVSRGFGQREAGGVLIVNAEDSPASTTRPRLEAAGADLARVFTLTAGDPETDLALSFPDDLELIERVVIDHDCRLLVVDPITAFFDGSLDYGRDPDVRKIIDPIGRLARRHELSAVVVAHLNKRSTTNAGQRFGGSMAFYNAVRSAFLLDRDPDDPEGDQGDQRVLVHVKTNDGRHMPSAVLKVEPVELDGGHETAKVVRVGDSDLTASELLERQTERKGHGKKQEAAQGLLQRLLSDHGWHPVSEVKATLEAAGMSESTIERAKRDLSVKTRKDPDDPNAYQWQHLPFKRDRPSSAQSAEGQSLNSSTEGKSALQASSGDRPSPSESAEGQVREGHRPNPFKTGNRRSSKRGPKPAPRRGSPPRRTRPIEQEEKQP